MRKLILLVAVAIFATSCYEGPAGTPTLFLVGDSIMEQSLPTLEPHLQQAHQTAHWAVEGASTEDNEDAIAYMSNEHPMDRIVINQGSNDIVQYSVSTAYSAMLRTINSIPDDTCIVWVGVKETDVTPFYHANWLQKARSINIWLKSHPDVVFLDWEKVSAGHPTWFQADGLHLSAAGQTVYNGQVARMLSSYC